MSSRSLTFEPLEGRAMLSYLVVPRGGTFVPVHVSDARANEPLFGNGLAAKKAPHFYPLYTGPQRPELNGTLASAYVSKKNLILTGTVDAPIVAKPATKALGAIYSFGIDRGNAGAVGPFPDRRLIRFDAIVNVSVTTKSVSATLAHRPDHQPARRQAAVASRVGRLDQRGDGESDRPPEHAPLDGPCGRPVEREFLHRQPPLSGGYASVASFTPDHTMFQVYVKRT